MRRPLLFALASLVLGAGCDNQRVSRALLPPGGMPIRSESASFRVYRFPNHGLAPVAVAAVDAFNRGLDDLAVANSGSSDVTLYRNLGDGEFREFGRFATCPNPDDIDAEDLTGDGFADILVTCKDHSVLTLLKGNGRGGFTRTDIPVSQSPIGAQSAPHLSGPGTPFIAVLHDTPASLELLLNDFFGQFKKGPELPVPGGPSSFVADVFTRDGSVSYAVTSQRDSTLSVYLNRDGDFTRKDYPAPEAAAKVQTLMPGSQGGNDLVVISGTQNDFRIYLNDSFGDFPHTEEYRLPLGPASSVASSHFRGDAQPELLFQSATTGDVVFYPNRGGGVLGAPEIIHAGAALTGLITGHLNHHADGMDAAMIDTGENEIVVLLNENGDY